MSDYWITAWSTTEAPSNNLYDQQLNIVVDLKVWMMIFKISYGDAAIQRYDISGGGCSIPATKIHVYLKSISPVKWFCLLSYYWYRFKANRITTVRLDQCTCWRLMLNCWIKQNAMKNMCSAKLSWQIYRCFNFISNGDCSSTDRTTAVVLLHGEY